MNSRKVTGALGVFLCLVAIFVVVRLNSAQSDLSASIQESAPAATRIDPPPRVQESVPVAKPAPRSTPQPAKRPAPEPQTEELTKIVPVDPDEEFLKKISSLPLPRAVLETRLEVEGRIKTSEKDRAKMIFSQEKGGKLTVAYAVKRPSVDEVEAMTKPFKLLLDLQDSYSAKKYIEEKYDYLFKSYRLAEAEYQLLYAVIPKSADGSPVEDYSYPASSEEECIKILREELAPRPPVVIGVPYTSSSRERSSSSSYGIRPGDWRMDQLVAAELLHPFYQSSDRALLLKAKGSQTEK
jgi:hypothetical protein